MRIYDQSQLADPDSRWQELANCRGLDPDLFYPDRGASTKDAKRVCSVCEVREVCLDYAIYGGEKFGIWGGKSERERREIRRERAMLRGQQRPIELSPA